MRTVSSKILADHCHWLYSLIPYDLALLRNVGGGGDELGKMSGTLDSVPYDSVAMQLQHPATNLLMYTIR